MQAPLVMTVIGPDRPGLVDSLAALVAGHGGNWLESRMSRLGGQFAGILRVQVPREQEQSLTQALKRLESQGLKIVVLPDHPEAAPSERALKLLELVGQDRPGIVSQISHALASHGVNVEDLNTECQSAPMSGETLFRAQAKLYIPATCNIAQLQKDLEKIAGDLIVEISLQELPVS
jgi:glycine cleavage system regulatory protein